MSQYFASLFRRQPNDGWFRVSRYDVTTVDIMAALAVFSMFLYAASPNQIFERLTFNAPAVRSGEIWRIVTWPIAEVPNIFALISIVFFWSFGQQLEALFGRGRFLAWVASVAIIPAVALTALGLLNNNFDFTSFSFGLGPMFLAGIWVYAATYPNVRWFEIIPLWAIAAIFTGLQLLGLSGDRASGAILFLLISVAAALFAGRSLGLASAWPIPHIPLAANGGRSARTRTPRVPKPSKPKRPKRGGDSTGRVVDGPWTAPSSPPMAGTPSSPPSSSASVADQAELDGLLDKIGAQGMDALSAAEKQRLNELSKRLRNR